MCFLLVSDEFCANFEFVTYSDHCSENEKNGQNLQGSLAHHQPAIPFLQENEKCGSQNDTHLRQNVKVTSC